MQHARWCVQIKEVIISLSAHSAKQDDYSRSMGFLDLVVGYSKVKKMRPIYKVTPVRPILITSNR